MSSWSQLWKKRRKQKPSLITTSLQVEGDGQHLFHALDDNIRHLKQEVGQSPDVIVREFELGREPRICGAVIYTEGLIDSIQVNDFIIRPLLEESVEIPAHLKEGSPDILAYLLSEALLIGASKEIETWSDLYLAVLSGDTVILVEGVAKGIACNTKGGPSRDVSEPTVQVTIRGPKDSFCETIGTNIALVRHRIKSPHLWLEVMRIGRMTRTEVAMLYLKDRALDSVVEEVRRRLQSIDIDSVLESGYIEECIQDHTFTPFPTMYNTERPDVVAGNLLEGKVAIFVDGTPFVLLAPTLFLEFFQSVEDYYQRFDISVFLRFLRYAGFITSLLGPSIYIAAITFHQEMIPTTLLIRLVATREGVPFPAFLEALIMEVSFEVLREAGERMPRAVGQAVSIVGALVLGQAAVQAGIVSPAMVIVVAITGIASFSTVSFNLAIAVRLLRFLFMIAATTFGFLGIALGMIALVAHMASLRTFGEPYLAGYAPFRAKAQEDAILRLPAWMLFKRLWGIGKEKQRKRRAGK